MTDGHAHFEDRTLATTYATDLKPLSLELRDFSTTADTDNAYDLHAEAGSGASLDWGGRSRSRRWRRRAISGSPMPRCPKHWGYVRESAGFEVSSGTLGFDGNYDFSAGNAGTQLTFKLRELGIDELGIRRIGEDTDTARLAKLTITNFGFDLAGTRRASKKCW